MNALGSFYADYLPILFLTVLFRLLLLPFFWRLFQSTTDDLHDSKWLDPRMFACHEISTTVAKQPERFKRSFFIFGTQAATVMMIGGTCLASVFYQNRSCSCFAASESMIKIGVPAMRILSIGLVFCGFSIMIATYQQAIEKIQSSMLIHILRQGILLVPFDVAV